MTRSREKYAGSYNDGRNVALHRAIVEKVLGKRLLYGAVIHHVDENPLNNEKTNLVVCPNEAYHNLLHRRMRAMEASGNPNYQKCQYCKEWDDPSNMSFVRKNDRPSETFWHAYCRQDWRNAARKAGKNV